MITQRTPTTWDELPSEVIANGEMFSTRALEKQYRDMEHELARCKTVVHQQNELLKIRDRRIKLLETMLREAKEATKCKST